jgi:Tfp pilus assembly protein PilF
MKNRLGIPAPERWKSLITAYGFHLHLLIILLLGIAAYANSLDVPLQFDDDPTVRIVNNLNTGLDSIQGFLQRARWFADVTFALNRHLHGERVLGYHVVNMAIHLLSAVVLYLFVQRAIEALRLTFRLPGDDECSAFLQRFLPFASAALFVSHPVQTQAVTYIAQRYTSLATLLYLGSLLSYLQARLALAGKSKPVHMWWWGSASLIAALLAMKSKEIAFTLPFMTAAVEAALFRGQLLKNRLFLAIAAGLLLVIPLQLISMHATGNPENLLQNIQSAATETRNISRTDYLLTQFRVVATYLRLLILPVNQNLDYDYPVYHSLFDPAVLAALLLHITLAGTGVTLCLRSRRCLASGDTARGVPMRIACLGIFWFYLALCVESSVIPIRDVIYEHRVYLPSAGFFMAAAAGIAGLAAWRQRYRSAFWVLTLLLCIALTAGTIARNRKWSSEMVLWQDVLEKSPNKARAQYSVGLLYFRRYMPEKALPHLVRALELDSAKQKHWNTLNAAVSIIGSYQGRSLAGKEYHEVDPGDRQAWMANSYNSLGLAYEHLGNRYLARENYRKAVSTNPSMDLAWYNLALLAARQNDSSTLATSLENLRAVNPQLEQHVVKSIRQEAPSVELKPQ